MKKRPPPVAIDPIAQKDIGDCGLAAIAMSLGVPYLTVSEKATKLGFTRVHQRGLWMVHILKLCRELGAPHRQIRGDIDQAMEERNGILGLDSKSGDALHAVTWWGGLVFNPADGLVWELQVYLQHSGMFPKYFLVRCDGQ